MNKVDKYRTHSRRMLNMDMSFNCIWPQVPDCHLYAEATRPRLNACEMHDGKTLTMAIQWHIPAVRKVLICYV